MATRKFLVCGSRDWDNYAVIRFRMSNMNGKFILIHGDAPGADTIAADIWERVFKRITIPFPANWKKYSKSAGPIRNTKMLADNPEIELILAFSNDISVSKGTKDMVTKAMKCQIPVEVIREDTYFHIEQT